MELKCTIPEPTPTEWIRLQSGKEFSRLLYTNPVCFLGTTSRQPTLKKADEDGDVKTAESIHNNAERNVMVLSWLTASNNNGRFLFSINKNRYSAELLARRRVDVSSESSSDGYKTDAEFSLSVPVKGMEEMIKDAGSISGRCCSKFQSDATTSMPQQPEDMHDNLSNRQRKKQKKENIQSNGILGLIPIALGSDGDTLLEESDLFAIKGTIAHMRCRVYALIGPSSTENLDASIENASGANLDNGQPGIDEDHLLIMAEVVDAYVHPSYWGSNKLIFRPRDQTVPPYLTFFGSQTFGYVVTSSDVNSSQH